jgi:hypothetical protein
MKRFFAAVCLAVPASACAIVDMPDPDAGQPAWAEQRIAAGDRRGAPAVIPVTSLQPGEEAALERSARELVAKRELLDAEAARLLAEQQSGTSDFLAEGQERTSPPGN